MRVLSDGRVRRTNVEWRAILKRFAKSGLTGAEFCAREEISTSAFATWKRKLSESEMPAPGVGSHGLRALREASRARPVRLPRRR